jgi:hypothetical protein
MTLSLKNQILYFEWRGWVITANLNLVKKNRRLFQFGIEESETPFDIIKGCLRFYIIKYKAITKYKTNNKYKTKYKTKYKSKIKSNIKIMKTIPNTKYKKRFLKF